MYWFEDAKFPLYLAPMAGYTDTVYRALCKKHGADVLVSEFIMAEALLREGPQAWEAVDFTEQQRPLGIQIFGAEPQSMADAAKLIAERQQPDFIDINYGCPSPKVCRIAAGSSLLQDLPRLQAVAAHVVAAVPHLPVTAKIRIGWDNANIVAAEAGQRLQDVGIRALAIHGRTKEQGYSGQARWDVIAEVAQTLEIPVIGNGNIHSAQDVRYFRNTAVKGLMIGRAALGYPWLFREIRHQLQTGETLPPPSLQERWQTILDFAQLLAERPVRKAKYGNKIGWMRARLKSLTKNMQGGRKMRNAIERLETLTELEDFVSQQIENTTDTQAQPQSNAAA